MAEGKRDENGVVVAMAKSQSTGLPVPLLVDHVTGYVLVVETTNAHPTPLTLQGRPDNNNVYTRLVKNSTTGEANALIIDSGGNLRITTA